MLSVTNMKIKPSISFSKGSSYLQENMLIEFRLPSPKEDCKVNEVP